MSHARSILRRVFSSASLIFADCRAMRMPLATLCICFAIACGRASGTPAQSADSTAAIAPDDFPMAVTAARPDIGFHSRRQLEEHFAKHGSEFGRVTRQEYLRQAQLLRDAPVRGSVEEIKRSDGTISRYDRASGAFVAFDADGTIRTFFKPNDGEAYFRRQALHIH
jgi:pyocin large subunit-like protein